MLRMSRQEMVAGHRDAPSEGADAACDLDTPVEVSDVRLLHHAIPHE